MESLALSFCNWKVKPLSKDTMMNRQMPSLVVALLLLILPAGAAADGHRNVLLLISDNQDQFDSGCYGNTVVQTPHIDQLATEGVRFDYAFATTASCGPSRAVIYTGLHTHANGQYGHAHGYHNFRLRDGVQTVFEMLKADGYATGMIGKAHIHPPEDAIEFQPKVNNRDVPGMARAAADFFQSAGDRPFFLAIGYSDPHPTSRDAPGWGIRRDFEGVDPPEYDPNEVIVPRHLPDRPEVREGRAGYYQQISRLDAGIGMVLSELREAGKESETLVIFTSDHGSSEPGAMANHYEPGVLVPFIVRHPGGEHRGSVNDAMITFVDLVPTILDWTGTAGPEYPLHGRSILPVLGQTDPEGWDEVVLSHVFHEVTMYYPMRTIRTRKHKLIWNLAWQQPYPLPIDTLARPTWQNTLRRDARLLGQRTVEKFLHRDPIELYDLERDPDEVINLADRPEYAELREELSAKLLEVLEETDDPWLLRYDIPQAGGTENRGKESEYLPLFNGKDLHGWQLRRAKRKGYVVEDGLLVCPADGGGYLFTEEEYADFSLRFDFRLSEGANNGVAIRTPLVDRRPAYEGMEIQILDNTGYDRTVGPTQYHGSLYDVAAAKRGALRPVGQWNAQEIICDGRRVTVILNEMVILDVHLDEIADPEVLEKHPGLQRDSGHIGLLGHGSRVEFRNLRIKPL